MSNILEQFDHYLKADGPAAIVTREPLIPVEGPDGVLFPSTFASGDGFPGGYNIDGDLNGENIALVDSVGSQANRIEPLFAEPEQAELVPQVVITAGAKKINLLEAGHRAGDAIVRCSSLQQELQDAFKALLDGNATSLAKIAPTSLVFGVWDSRDTQAKMPRLIASTIRAYNVRKLTRSAQYVPATEYVGNGLLSEATDKAAKDAYAERGFIHVPATGSHGGIIAKGGIRRDATLAIAALKLITAGSDAEATLKLRRYILGLALVAFTKLPGGYLRQGTILVSDPDKERKTDEVYANGSRKPFTVTHDEVLKYAKAAAKDFGVGESREVPFDAERAKKDLEPKEKKPKAKKEK
ncbi:type I-U CRISPR-associated RAMP protein Csb1/Cas7u [Prosthecobacter sp.]|uniref:type I-G CRISPR-associated RAMP protein Csb1/Cas7g n=1 Tax=Prosthecobacter sp. TaxID=1965333 RepID=UPI00378457D2